MPDSLFLRPDPAKWAVILFICIIFTCLGLGIVTDPNSSDWKGWLAIGFFGGLGIPLSAVTLFTKAFFLRLDAHGIQFRRLTRLRRYAWADIAEFRVRQIVHGQYAVVIQFTEAGGSGEATLPDTYGFRAEELAQKLNLFRRGQVEEPVVDPEICPQGL